MSITDAGGVVKGKLHSECDEHGCGVDFTVKGTSQEVEMERDEAVIIPEAFENECFRDSFCKKPKKYKMTGTTSQIASAINAMGGGTNWNTGAQVWKNGRKINVPKKIGYKFKKPFLVAGGSVVINRTNMLSSKEHTFEGTSYEIASKINSYGGNGVKLVDAAGNKLGRGGYIMPTSKEDAKEYIAWYKEIYADYHNGAFSRKKNPLFVVYPKIHEYHQMAKVILGIHDFQRPYEQLIKNPIYHGLTKVRYDQFREKHGIGGNKLKLDGGKIEKENKGGDCYFIAGKYAMDRVTEIGGQTFIGTPHLIHAQVLGQGAIAGIPYGHAFIEDDFFVYDFSNGNEFIMPKHLYYDFGKIEKTPPIFFRYTFEEAIEKMVQTGQYGSWDLQTESGL